MSNLPHDGGGNWAQLFKPHPGFINKDSALPAVTITDSRIWAFHCHSDGELVCTTADGPVTIPCVEGMQWAFPDGTTVVTISTGTFSFM